MKRLPIGTKLLIHKILPEDWFYGTTHKFEGLVCTMTAPYHRLEFNEYIFRAPDEEGNDRDRPRIYLTHFEATILKDPDENWR